MNQIGPTSSGFSAYPGEPSVFVAAAQWVEATLTGSLATAISVIAIATVGFLMLSGRVNVRRGLTVILGCFILFGAATLAQGLLDIAGVRQEATSPRIDAIPVATSIDPALTASPPDFPADPYAGAAIRR